MSKQEKHEAGEAPSPSAKALEVAKDIIVTIQESYGVEYKAGEPVDDVEWRLWASTLDRFAQQAVAAELARIVGRLEEIRRGLRGTFDSDNYGRAINIVKGEQS